MEVQVKFISCSGVNSVDTGNMSIYKKEKVASEKRRA